ncbi:PilW family protein [Colwellia ponticola]|uniref:Prepilin-type N-terminal cleavage/methylation domain-containing protein n=1 Tax=Colwellia ponticola TaxID=2304625 RepID=A0A8H2JLM1_9GAMM|nr:PilW family protein [Colwellia ponticola]TMM45927.1 prepilin-type N-terminal cleavage/methylation domain-containing protein [Colwellia ponticola]
MNELIKPTKPITKRAFHKTQGFTLVELMVSLSVGLVIFAGVMSVFVGMRTTTAQTSSYGELQENGRFAISVLTDDLLRQNFWGDLSGTLSQSTLISIPAQPGNNCTGEGVNNATFPQATGPFRTLWGQTIVAGALNPLGCFSMPANTRTMVGSDVIQLKRVIANPVAAPTAGNYYLTSNLASAAIFAAGDAVPTIDNSRLWQYQHHVYYVREVSAGNDFVPVLIQGRLANFSMNFAPVIDGIERIRFMYGVDTDIDPTAAGYGIVDAYISADNMTQQLWDNAGGTRVLAVQVFVLARSIRPDNKYTNKNSYQLGDDLPFTPEDNYRRLLFSSTVTLYNNSVESW